MTLAKQVKTTISETCLGTFSLYAGYSMNGGKYVHFPRGVQLKENRNDRGRVTRAVYQYADGSVLTYTYNENVGYKLTASV